MENFNKLEKEEIQKENNLENKNEKKFRTKSEITWETVINLTKEWTKSLSLEIQKEKIDIFFEEIERINNDFNELFNTLWYKNFKEKQDSYLEPPYEIYEEFIWNFEAEIKEIKEKFEKEKKFFKNFKDKVSEIEDTIENKEKFIKNFKFLLENKPIKIETWEKNTKNLRKIIAIWQTHISPEMNEDDFNEVKNSQEKIYLFLKYFQKNNIQVWVEWIINWEEKNYDLSGILETFISLNQENFLNKNIEKQIDNETKKILKIKNMNPFYFNIQGLEIKTYWESEEDLREIIKIKIILENLEIDWINLNILLKNLDWVNWYINEWWKIKIKWIEYKWYGKEYQVENFNIKNLWGHEYNDNLIWKFWILYEYFLNYTEEQISENKINDKNELKILKNILENKDNFLNSNLPIKNNKNIEITNSKIFNEFVEDIKKILIFWDLTFKEVEKELENFIKKYNIKNKDLEKLLRTNVINWHTEQQNMRDDSAISSMSKVEESQKILPYIIWAWHLNNIKDRTVEWNKNNNEKFDFYYIDLSK